jgi:hypothetical protein
MKLSLFSITCFLLLVAVVAAVLGVLTVPVISWLANHVKPVPAQVACTQEAKICPDGTAVGRTGPNCEFAACPDAVAFGSAAEFTVGKTVAFQDGLSVRLEEVNDSRCKPNVVCVWAGELSPLFSVTGGSIGKLTKEVQMGTATTKQTTVDGYIFTLNDATTTSVVLTITKQVASGNCYVGGCSNEICSDQQGAVSNCIYQNKFACYKTATCARQSDGKCGWTQSAVLAACLNNTK